MRLKSCRLFKVSVDQGKWAPYILNPQRLAACAGNGEEFTHGTDDDRRGDRIDGAG